MSLRIQSVILSLIIVAVVGTVGSFLYKRTGAYYLQEIRTTTTGYAHLAALLVDGDVYEGFSREEGYLALPAFNEVCERMRAFMEGDGRIRQICTMSRTNGPNTWKMILDVAPSEKLSGNGTASELEMAEFPEGAEGVTARPVMQKALAGAIADFAFHRDQGGWWLSAYSPILNSRDKAVGIIQVKISADTIRQEMAKTRNAILLSSVLVAVLVLVVLHVHASRLGKRMDGGATSGEEKQMVRQGQRRPGAGDNTVGLVTSVDSITKNSAKGFDKLSILSRIADISATSSDLGQALDTSVKLALEATKSTRGAIFLVRENGESIELATSHGIEGMERVGEECFVGTRTLPTVLERDPEVHVQKWLDLTGCTRCFFLKIRDSLRGVFLLNPNVEDEEFLQTLMTEISFGVEIARLLRDAITDTTTGLFMKRYFQIQLDTETKRSQRYKMGLSLLMLDIDHFKTVNDTCGHQFGDLVLREIAKIITRCVRKTDVVARYGGDEMVIILPDATRESASMVANRILKGVQDKEFQYEGKSVKLTVSMGISSMAGEEPLSSEQLLRLADSALYKAKEAGKNTVYVV
ncbi:MAG: GGDEF domain-containing protein [Thermodesulfobacteriota bacterium]|nr:GGDEF domain-containing protein [Thermodesulfobacteriota bacterium]